LSLVPPFIGDQGDLDANISDSALHQPIKKAFRGGQALLVTAALSTSASASPARISIYTNKRSALASPAKGKISISKNIKKAPQRSLEASLEQVIKDGESTYLSRKMAFDRSLGIHDLFGKPRKNLGGYSWLLVIDSSTKKQKQILQRQMLVHPI
jgi:hypothetical protein